jgi:hypothetical protein
MEPGTKEKT